MAMAGDMLLILTCAVGLLDMLAVLWTVLFLYFTWKLGDLGYKLEKIEYQLRQSSKTPPHP